jgi:hypothetical protein
MSTRSASVRASDFAGAQPGARETPATAAAVLPGGTLAQ